MKKYLAILLTLLMLVAAFAGCGERKDPETPVNPGTPADPSTSAAEPPYGWFRNYFTNSATTLNVFATQDTGPHLLADYCTASMYCTQLNEDRKSYSYVGEIAKDYPVQVDAEGKVWRITLRDGLKWSNGDVLNADDIIYSVKMLLDPIMINLSASTVTTNMYGRLVNALEYQQQALSNTVKWEDVGLKKIDDLTIEMTLTEPATQFKAMRFSSSFYIVNDTLFEKGMSSDRSTTNYGTAVEYYTSCGPFILTEWVPDAKFVLARNPDWIYADKIKIEGIIFTVVPNAQTAIELFMKDQLDTVSIAYTDWETFEDDPRVHEYFNDSLMYFFINLGNPNNNGLLGNINFRQALYWGADRVTLANTIGVLPASRLVRKAVIGNTLTNTAFVDIPASYVPDPTKIYDPVKANQYLNKAYEECKVDTADMQILLSETATHIRAASELLQKQYPTVFNNKLNVTIRAVPSSQAQTLRRWNPADPTAYDTALGSLLPSASDPRLTFNFYQSTYSPPRFCYANPEFDAFYLEAAALDLANDAEKVIELCQKMEKMLLEELVVVPIYERPEKTLYSSRIQLPVDNYIVSWGFGEMYSTIKK